MERVLHARARMRSWLTVALCSLLAGCYQSHGTHEARDGGLVPPAIEGGIDCRPASPLVHSMRCSTGTVGGTAIVTVDTTPDRCCSTGAVSSAVNALAPGSWDVQLAWTACECCDACRCTSPSQSVAVTVGPLVPGTNVVTAYGAPCTIVASLPSFCTPADVGEFRAPFDLIEGQAFSATLTSGFTTGCACTPRVDVVSAGVAYELALEVCDCCVDCECVDSGYQSSVVLDPPSLGTHTLIFPHGAGQLEVHERSQCSGIDATRLEIVAPDDGVIVTGPRLHWAHVYGEQALCCAVPAPVVERSDPSPRTIALSLLSCVVDPCDCVPSERTPTDAWFSLEELTSGEYTVTLGSLAQRVVVP